MEEQSPTLPRRAVEDACTRPGVVRLHFQPVVDLARGVVAGYEALARFAGPPQAPPDVWFAAAHRHGLGDILEARALGLALEARAALPRNTFLTVNLTPPAVLSGQTQLAFRAAGDLRGLVVEITEQAPVEDYPELLAALAPLREEGALLAVDDAGAGFASLKHITTLRPDFVKVDRGLVSGIAEDETKAALVETLGIFASRVDAWLVAEGVETRRELDRLLALGVPLGQGYGLGRPTPAMAPLDPAVADACRSYAAVGDRDLLRLVESVPVVPASGGDAAVAEALLRSGDAEWAAVVDEFGRPVWLVQRGGGRIAGGRRHAVLAVDCGESLADVARRVVARDASERFDPVAVCDEIGRLRGIVGVERLLWALANEVDGDDVGRRAA